MAENQQEALASLRLLVCLAKADGDISEPEQTVLSEALEQLGPSSTSMTLEQLIAENMSVSDLLPQISMPDAQQAVYNAAQALAEQDGVHPAQQQILDQMQANFQISAIDQAKSEIAQPDQSKLETASYGSLTAGIQIVAQRNRQVRNLILDYALGAAVIGLIPIRGLFLLQVIALFILIIKMRRNIRALWGFPKGHDILAFVGSWFGGLGALGIALMAWLTVLAIGVFLPHFDSLARAAAFATLTWAEGQVTNQFHISSSRMDQIAFQQFIQPTTSGRWR